MTIAQWVVIGLIVIPLGLITTNRIRLDVAAMMIAIALGIAQFAGLGVLGQSDSPDRAVLALAGLSEPVTVTLFSLFVLTQALEKTGITHWLANRVLIISGNSERKLIPMLATMAAFFSLFMNNLAAGALLLPSAMEIARRTGVRPSKLLIPVAFGSCLGGAATYFTTANIIASDLLRAANPPQIPLRVLDFTGAGGLVAIAGIGFLTLFGPRLLPSHEPSFEQGMARKTGSDLEDAYGIGERLWEIHIPADSPIANKNLNQTGIGGKLGLAVVALWHRRSAIFAPRPDQVIQAGDILLIVGREERVQQLSSLGMHIGRENSNGYASQRGILFTEIVMAPNSDAEGHTLKELEFRRNYGFTAVALRRDGCSYRTDVADFALRPGDSLLVVGPQSKQASLRKSAKFLVLETDPSDQPINRSKAVMAVAITLGTVVSSILGFPIYLAVLIGAVLVLVGGLLTVEEVYRKMEWQAIILIAGMYPISLAMVQTGLADIIGREMVKLVAPLGPLGLVGGAYLLTAALSQVIAGQVTTLITAPVVISAAIRLGANPQAVAVASAIACSASFVTPLAHPVNILMIGPGNYNFGDFFRVGWGLTLLSFVVLMIGMIIFWKV